MVQLIDPEPVQSHQAKQQVHPALVSEGEGTPFDLLADIGDDRLERGKAVVLGQLGSPTHLVGDVLVVRLHPAGGVRESACPGGELVPALVP